MIARIWKGHTRWEDVSRYLEYLHETGVAEYASVAGNRGSEILCRREGEKAEFVVISYWDSLDSIRHFAGEEIERAVFYPEDDRFLVDRELTVKHYEILHRTPSSPGSPA